MSSPSDGRTFSQRLADALNARLYPRTALHRKQVAWALNVSTDTIKNWCAARGEPSFGMVMELIQFFDPAFAGEISGGVIIKPPTLRTAEAMREMERTIARTKELALEISGMMRESA